MSVTTDPSKGPAARIDEGSGATRVLWMSTLAFTLMFAVWLMFGVLGVPIQKELGLSDPELAWISAVAVLNGSMWRLPAGMLTDRIGGRIVTISSSATRSDHTRRPRGALLLSHSTSGGRLASTHLAPCTAAADRPATTPSRPVHR